MFEISINFSYQLQGSVDFKKYQEQLHSTGKAPIPYQGEFGYSN
ncbi:MULTISPECIES: hypothetical protein [Bacillus]|nr:MULTISPECIES: hypothetical protein [Bacillus]MCR4383354.1 hypothetical protein [Bacillus subtilis]MEC0286015.1 hypothetical protein [Bacillus subtilis]MEC0292355.1 hypothetical protein [Bacillus subtilis]MEC0337906.1 hypothetical protein [Bacillus subtilis]MEC0440694.1 hypothetical protein [Bacillus subtilis]